MWNINISLNIAYVLIVILALTLGVSVTLLCYFIKLYNKEEGEDDKA
jgi:hypothetical protein